MVRRYYLAPVPCGIPTLHKIVSICLFCTLANGASIWFGDKRSYMNTPRTPPFNELIYDENIDCPLESDAIPNYLYFGQFLSAMYAEAYIECITECFHNARCIAVNYFEPIKSNDRPFCELLAEGQYDNPQLLRPFRKAIYFENIMCSNMEEQEAVNDEASKHVQDFNNMPIEQEVKISTKMSSERS